MLRSLPSVGRTTKTTRKAKRVIRKWRLERFEDREALRAEVSGFSESIRGKIEKGMKGHGVVSEVLQEWEGIVNRVYSQDGGWREGDCVW